MVESALLERRDMENKILSQQDLYDVLPFGKTKVLQLIKSGELPLVKVGKDYITTFNLLEEWIKNHIGEEIYYRLIINKGRSII